MSKIEAITASTETSELSNLMIRAKQSYKRVSAYSAPANDPAKPPTLGFPGLKKLQTQMLMFYTKIITPDLEPPSPSPDSGFPEHKGCSVIVQ